MISLVFVILLFIFDELSLIEAGVSSTRFQLTNAHQPLSVSADYSYLLECAMSCSGAPGCSGYTFTKFQSNSESCQLLFDQPSSDEKNLVNSETEDAYMVMERYDNNPNAGIESAILDSETTITTLSTTSSLPSCNGQTSTFKLSSGSFTSDNYPAPYGANLNCTWIINTSTVGQLNVTFNNVDLEDTTNCTEDKLLLFSGPNIFGNRLAMKCGTASSAASFIINTNKAVVQFLTDSHEDPTHMGFMVTYAVVMPTG